MCGWRRQEVNGFLNHDHDEIGRRREGDYGRRCGGEVGRAGTRRRARGLVRK